jgi:hypothetical protein
MSRKGTSMIRNGESRHDMRGRLLHRSRYGGHLLVLCILP